VYMDRRGMGRRRKDGLGDVCAEEGMEIGVVEV
jgi:hypothetical protein